MKTLTKDQINTLKIFAIEALKGMNFQENWLTELKRCFDNDTDCSCNAFELARYISWNMKSSNIYSDNETFADLCSFQAVLFGTNEMINLTN